MPTSDEVDFPAFGSHRPSAEDMIAVKQNATRRAHRMRSQMALTLLRRMATAVIKGTTALVHAASAALVRLHNVRANRRAIAKLQSLDEAALKDIGIRRSEIESVVRAHDDTRARRDEKLVA